MADSPETEYYRRGWDAAIKQAERRIRDAERSRDDAFTMLVHVHSLAKHTAELSRPAFDLEVWRREHEISPRFVVPPPGPDETGVWRKVDGYEREPEPEEEPEDDSPATHYYRAGWEAAIEQLTGSLAIRGEQPEDTARRIRTELAALRGALADVRQQLLLATEAASRAQDGEGEAKRALLHLEQQVDSSTSGIDGVAEDTGSPTQRLVYVATLASDSLRLAGELAALEWLVRDQPMENSARWGWQGTRPGEVWVQIDGGDVEWCGSYAEAARKCGWEK